MGVDGAATFSSKRLVFKQDYRNMLHMQCLSTVTVTSCISFVLVELVYTTLTTLWKYFHYTPRRVESLKEIQHVLNLPEMNVIKLSDTRWLRAPLH